MRSSRTGWGSMLKYRLNYLNWSAGDFTGDEEGYFSCLSPLSLLKNK